MLWLFGEIWLWLLIAFVLGLALAVAAFLSMRRHRRETSTEDSPAETASRATDVPDTERTQLIPRVQTQQYGGERPPEAAPPSWSTPSDIDDIPGEGRLQGTLPISPSEWHARNEWPDERDIARTEGNRPRREH